MSSPERVSRRHDRLAGRNRCCTGNVVSGFRADSECGRGMKKRNIFAEISEGFDALKLARELESTLHERMREARLHMRHD